MEHHLLSWGFNPGPSSIRSTPDGPHPNVAVFDGPPRVLEVVSSSISCQFHNKCSRLQAADLRTSHRAAVMETGLSR